MDTSKRISTKQFRLYREIRREFLRNQAKGRATYIRHVAIIDRVGEQEQHGKGYDPSPICLVTGFDDAEARIKFMFPRYDRKNGKSNSIKAAHIGISILREHAKGEFIFITERIELVSDAENPHVKAA